MSMVFPNLPTGRKNEITVGVIQVEFTYPDGEPVKGLNYEMTLSTGGSRRGTLDANGKLKEENIPPGAKGTVRLTGIPLIALSQ